MSNENNTLQIETSKKTTRKYPNVIWFPRSKTDPREIREVLKLALIAQDTNPEGFFNDKILGERMARIGSINVIGLEGDKYIESYAGKSTANTSYITNARMLMRLFRFLGLVTRIKKGKYVVTDLGRKYSAFSGDFPSYKDKDSEEKVLLGLLGGFCFYSVNDDSTFRDSKFKIRPFYWLLRSLEIEPQCIYQLIVTTFASQNESNLEVERIRNILNTLRGGETNLKLEWERLGLAPDDYSCVHNFYDSAKILVYLGTSLGLISKTSNPAYGKKISGNARHLKQATIFYTLTDKGKKFVEENSKNKLVYYDDLYNVFKDESIIESSYLLASLNHQIGNVRIKSISKDMFSSINNLNEIIQTLKSKFNIVISEEGGMLRLDTPLTFSFYQSIPPEITHSPKMLAYYNNFMLYANNKNKIISSEEDHSPIQSNQNLVPYFELDSTRRYTPTAKQNSEFDKAIQYEGMENIFGGSDRFSSRVSPTNTVIFKDNCLYIDCAVDALDLLVPLRLNDPNLEVFIEDNALDLVSNFIIKSDTWEKDQHYTWVRNCFRHLGMEATYSGSGGMLSRADVTVIKPIVGGIEAKSPRENRGTINLKAIRQAVEAKIQVVDKLKTPKDTPTSAMAIGRRISTLAMREEKKWAKVGQPVLIITDAILYYIIIRSASVKYSPESLIELFTKNNGVLTQQSIISLFEKNVPESPSLEKIKKELSSLTQYFVTED